MSHRFDPEWGCFLRETQGSTRFSGSKALLDLLAPWPSHLVSRAHITQRLTGSSACLMTYTLDSSGSAIQNHAIQLHLSAAPLCYHTTGAVCLCVSGHVQLRTAEQELQEASL